MCKHLATASGRIEWEAKASRNRQRGILDMLIHSRNNCVINSIEQMLGNQLVTDKVNLNYGYTLAIPEP
ncbi:hypothetical protein PN36_14035 [Candidatus Thiomargarita nelsonii]|uniref:Uncharacterized protein n=1 Tax=Candidatus Thiomargarita nelsonii TaxID=1003181 RepID=A0A4E0R3T1_9GAMM|nr:hypothetical protein PN36_14035 [Candidatus Thiomargarita nelsonii]